ncbi:DCC1-like thiol-disulfide oxidoreductase family protein [Pseudohalioglobus lutimaris]|uniref:DUF393 domain-containing protein n=1 Tax=Pseudohalioglobus lutimaris TaxID=1737061 RepID=A0A2N5WXW3_9GAMM|nr:DCC1-like thiol-disulfide oxidoreductase family protein [Pseudohalioglobus lutimaris]PLW67076.1 DUF393 domain-containing protein [Pseudohalioglobus lutimaris]
MSAREVLLVYDTQCPACAYYCTLVRLRESVGELTLVDARQPSEVMKQVTDRGLDIDQGMVLIVNSEFYDGADAINALALLGTRSGWFNRFNYWVFRSAAVSRMLYPVLKLCRHFLLHFLGVSKINNLESGNNERF